MFDIGFFLKTEFNILLNYDEKLLKKLFNEHVIGESLAVYNLSILSIKPTNFVK